MELCGLRDSVFKKRSPKETLRRASIGFSQLAEPIGKRWGEQAGRTSPNPIALSGPRNIHPCLTPQPQQVLDWSDRKTCDRPPNRLGHRAMNLIRGAVQ